MTLDELIRRFRVIAQDTVTPYLWGSENVTDWLNDAQRQACIRGRLLAEDLLDEVCSIQLQEGLQTYALHPAVYEIIDIRVIPAGGQARRLSIASREWLDAHLPHWRDDAECARYAIQDDTRIRLVGRPKDGDVLRLECYRLPMENMEQGSDEPEIHEAHHEHLIQWALHKAFSVPDAEGFDPQRAALAEQAFTAYFGSLPDSDMRRITREDVPHVNVGVLP